MDIKSAFQWLIDCKMKGIHRVDYFTDECIICGKVKNKMGAKQ